MVEFPLLLASALMGYAGAPYLAIVLAALMLTLAGARDDLSVSNRFSRLGSIRVFGQAMALSTLSNLMFAALAFFLGRVVAQTLPL